MPSYHPPAFGIFNSLRVSNARGDVAGHVGLSVFGTVSADLKARPLPYGETRISVSSIFGTVVVRVPDDVGVKVTGLSVFSTSKVKGERISGGTVESQEYETPGYSRMGKRLRIDATMIFGTLKIKT
jgi:predicted membrane protein